MTDSYITHDEFELVSNKGEERHKLKEGIRMSDIEKNRYRKNKLIKDS